MAITFIQEPELVAGVESPIIFKVNSPPDLVTTNKYAYDLTIPNPIDYVSGKIEWQTKGDTRPSDFRTMFVSSVEWKLRPGTSHNMWNRHIQYGNNDRVYLQRDIISSLERGESKKYYTIVTYSSEKPVEFLRIIAINPGEDGKLELKPGSHNVALTMVSSGEDTPVKRDNFILAVDLYFRAEGEVEFRRIYNSTQTADLTLDVADILNKELANVVSKRKTSNTIQSQINGEYYCQISEIYGTPATAKRIVKSGIKKVTKQLLKQENPGENTHQNTEIQLIVQPGKISFSGNPMIFKIKSWLYLETPGTSFVGHLSALKSFPVGSKICFQFSDERVEMVAAATPDQSGNQFLADATAPSATQLAPYFRANYTLNKYYIIEAIGSIIIFTARKTGVFYNWQSDPFLTTHALGIDTKERDSFRFLFELFFRKQGDDDFKTIYSEQIAQDTPFSGIMTIDVAKNLDAMLDDNTLFGKKYIDCINSKGEYYCQFAEIYGYKPQIQKVNTSAIKHVVKGGLSYKGFKLKKLIDILSPGNLYSEDIFLKQGPRVIHVHKSQPEYLYFINTRASSKKLSLQVQVIHTDGSINRASIEGKPVDNYDKIAFNVGYTALNLEQFTGTKGKKIKEYKVWLINQTDAIVSETITYRVVETNSPVRYFVYSSSFGTLDTLVTKGHGTQEYELNGQSVTRPQSLEYALVDGHRTDFNLKLQRTFTVATGWLEKPQFDALADFFIAEKKWIVKDGIPLPITVTSKKAGEYHDNKALIAQSFEYRYNFEDFNYTEGDA